MSNKLNEWRGHVWKPRVLQASATVTMSPEAVQDELRRLAPWELSSLFAGGPVAFPVRLVQTNGALWALPERGPEKDLEALHQMRITGWPDVAHVRIDIEDFWGRVWDGVFENAAAVTLSHKQLRLPSIPGADDQRLQVVAEEFERRFRVDTGLD